MVHYNIVRHRGDWAVEINGIVYDDPTKFEADFPKALHTNTRFSSSEDMDFSWAEMHKDMVMEWGTQSA